MHGPTLKLGWLGTHSSSGRPLLTEIINAAVKESTKSSQSLHWKDAINTNPLHKIFSLSSTQRCTPYWQVKVSHIPPVFMCVNSLSLCLYVSFIHQGMPCNRQPGVLKFQWPHLWQLSWRTIKDITRQKISTLFISWHCWIYFKKPKQSKRNLSNHKLLSISKEKLVLVLANIKRYMTLCMFTYGKMSFKCQANLIFCT